MKKEILQQCIHFVEFLGNALGQDYEVVLHDLDSDPPAIAAITNGHISGRTIGSPVTDAALQMLSARAYEANDYVCNYKGITEDGHILRSSTMFLKDSSGKPIGLLCINFDDSRFQELQGTLLSTIHPGDFLEPETERVSPPIPKDASVPAPTAVTESFPVDISSLMQKIFDDATVSLPTSIDRLNQYERKEIIEKLNEQGLFQLKGAISFVAKKFSCSTATIYRYLSEIGD
ncbi:MAG: PAS domain-containing protein [Lachnospiraceae bacterium]